MKLEICTFNLRGFFHKRQKNTKVRGSLLKTTADFSLFNLKEVGKENDF